MYKQKYHFKDISNLTILITGGAGFIGSNLVEYLIKYNVKKLRVLDNLSTGYMENLKKFHSNKNFEFIEGDIRNIDDCRKACSGVDYILHQAALGSVPRSIEDPLSTNEVNIGGFLNILVAAKENNIKRVVYAASSSTYGDSKELPKSEEIIGKPLSPYAVTKLVNELYADVFAKTYSMELIGLRYFNVFGPNQSPNGAYAAVIPLFVNSIRKNEPAYINGDGEQTRDFTFVENVVQANIKAMLVESKIAVNQVYNVAYGERISLNELWNLINKTANKDIKPKYRESRIGDIKDSLADISKAKKLLDYSPKFDISFGINYLVNNI